MDKKTALHNFQMASLELKKHTKPQAQVKDGLAAAAKWGLRLSELITIFHRDYQTDFIEND